MGEAFRLGAGGSVSSITISPEAQGTKEIEGSSTSSISVSTESKGIKKSSEGSTSLVSIAPEKGLVGDGYFSITNDPVKWTNTGHDNAVFLLNHPSVPEDFWSDVAVDGSNIRVYF